VRSKFAPAILSAIFDEIDNAERVI